MSLSGFDWAPVGLWLTVVASGLYHGINPAMGWPLAVAGALMERRPLALVAALGSLAAGHLLAMLVTLLPFALLAVVLAWQQQIQIGAGLLVVAFGVWQLVVRRHPRFLARIPPAKIALWSFAVAVAHGAGLMLVPIYLGICRTVSSDSGHAAASSLVNSDVALALVVSLAHTLAMLLAGGLMAWLVYRFLGLKFIAQSWFNLDAVWAVSLIVVGALSLFVGAH